VLEAAGGATAADLGILQGAPGAGATLTGGDLDPVLSMLTDVTLLAAGAGIDLASGITITNGMYSATVDFSAAVTVEDIINAINQSGTYLEAVINDTGTGIDIISKLSGVDFSIGENGGTTATDLGIRSFDASTLLSHLNHGAGISTIAGDDFIITQRDGTTISVDVSSAGTIQDVLDLINGDAENTGDLVASLAPGGNGIHLVDSSVSAGYSLSVGAVNFSTAAQDLGINKSVAGNTLTGDDVNPYEVNGIFTSLIRLKNALYAGNNLEISRAVNALESNLESVVDTQGLVGSRLQRLEMVQLRLADEIVDITELLSEKADLDFAGAIAAYELQLTTLEASLATTTSILGISLIQYL
jgi:flagellar hook-associated protein 3 FlgL